MSHCARSHFIAANVLGLTLGCLGLVPIASAQTVISSRLTLDDPAISDQDDMCIWIHPLHRSLSIIITSDKAARKLFVYDLQGATLQTLTLPGQPGNIDIRYGFVLSGEPVDIVAVNDRNNRRIEVYRVNPATRQLTRVDNGAITTAPNYGLCLYRSAAGVYYAFTTAENGAVEQYALRDQGGQVAATRVRNWSFGSITEGCVCDDETGLAYFGQEDVGIWKVGAGPGDPVTASQIAAVGDASGLAADVEGLTIYYAANGQGYLIASSQGSDNFKVYQRQPPHAYLRTVRVTGVINSDGIDVTNMSLGPAFPAGIFAVHNDAPAQKTVEVCAYQDMGLAIDTLYWNPRLGGGGPTHVVSSSVQAEPGRVRLAWHGIDGVGLAARVYRRTEASGWSAIGEARVAGVGRVVFEDREVEAGSRYGYRLGLRFEAGEELLGEVWVDVPRGHRLALHGARPNPVERDLIVSFSLADDRPALFELHDLAGRRLWSRRLESLGPGSHQLNLGEPGGLPGGAYWVRLSQGADSSTCRVTLAP